MNESLHKLSILTNNTRMPSCAPITLLLSKTCFNFFLKFFVNRGPLNDILLVFLCACVV